MTAPREPGSALPALAIAAPALLVQLGSAPLQRAEVYFLDAARAMADRGDWLLPTFRGQPFFDKPPLAYWQFAGAFEAFGPELLAARLLSVAWAVVSVVVTWRLGCLLFDGRVASAAALVLATTPGFLAMSRLAMSDMPLTALCLAAVLLGLRAAEAPVPATPRLVACGALLGLAFLTKGPIALLFTLAPMLALAPRLARPRPLLTVASTALLVASPWFAWLALERGPAPLLHFFWRENVARFSGTAYASGRGPFFYLGVYLSLGLPWALLLPLGLRRLAASPPARRLAAAVLVMALPLSLSSGKIEYYLLPLYPWLALLVARGLTAVDWDPTARRLARVACVLLALGTLLIGTLALRLPPPWAPPLPLEALLGLAALASVALLLRAARRGDATAVRVAMAASVALVAPALVAAFLGPTWVVRPQSLLVTRIAAEVARAPATRVVACHDAAHVERALLFEHRIVVAHDCALGAVVRRGPPALLVLHEDDLARLGPQPRIEILERVPYLPPRAFQQALRGETATPLAVSLARVR
jgi:4-amino-4-deoxy-L-arabinose transferase-like glycosyltransferase